MNNSNKFIIIAGPCLVETKEICETVAQELKRITTKLDIEYIFKASYRKANRTSISSFVGIGDRKALDILAEIRQEFNVKVITDIHSPQEAPLAAEYCDALQIPAFLSRQTELLQAAGMTGKLVNIKKGQFMAPVDIIRAAEKVTATGNHNVWLTERGTSFGYHDLVVDMRGMIILKQSPYPVLFDATHSVQQPSIGVTSGGQPQFSEKLALAAVATGIDGVFFETHPEPTKAKSDASTQLPLEKAENFIKKLLVIREAVCSLKSLQ